MLASVVACCFFCLSVVLCFFLLIFVVVPKSNKELCVFLSSLCKAFPVYYEKAKPFPVVGEVLSKAELWLQIIKTMIVTNLTFHKPRSFGNHLVYTGLMGVTQGTSLLILMD